MASHVTQTCTPPVFTYVNINGVDAPQEYIDPISNELMRDPVTVFPSGLSYNQSTIDRLDGREGFKKDPATKQVIQSVTANSFLKAAIERFLAQNPKLKEQIEEERASELQVMKVTEYTSNAFGSMFVENRNFILPTNQAIVISDLNPHLMWRVIKKKTKTLRIC